MMDIEWRKNDLEAFCLSILERGGSCQSLRGAISKWFRGAGSKPHDGASLPESALSKEPQEPQRPVAERSLGGAQAMHRGLQPGMGWLQSGSEVHWQKLGQLLDQVEAALPSDGNCSPEGFLFAVEAFALGPGRWLKIAGGAKASVLEKALISRCWNPAEVAFECGTFVGYSTVRLAKRFSDVAHWRNATPQDGGGGVHSAAGHHAIVTVEVSPVQACVARHFIDLTGLTVAAEVWVGQVRDVTPRLLEEFGERGIGLLFLDHKGQVFHRDLEQCERLGLLGRGAHVVADNVVSPGAPLLLWRLTYSGGVWASSAWALHEFLEPDQEDWMVIAALAQWPRPGEFPPPPEPLKVLAWETDHLRRRSEGHRPAEAPVRGVDRARFARYVAETYKSFGMEARPWSER
mmetsp:Transcript_6158/g.13974  ORF Transcript_6158/g.13974 Transcript_6158/m.13974 type:complete len:404 (-) Transcript_6158:44-1255(-)